MKTSLAITCLLLSATTLFAQIDERKKAIELSFAISNASAITGGSIYLPTDYVMDQNNKIIGQKYIADSFSDRFTISNEGRLELNFFGEQIFSYSIIAPGCRRYNKGLQDFNATYNDQGKVARLESRNWSGYGKGIWLKERYLFEYTDNQLVKLTSMQLIGEGKSSSAAVVAFEYTKDESTLTWKNEHEVVNVTTTYRGRRKQKDPTVVDYTRTYTLTIGKGTLFKSTTPDEQTIEVKTEGKEVTMTSYLAAYKKKTASVFKHDEKNLAVFISSSTFENDQFKGKVETNVQYSPKAAEPGLGEECNLQYKNFHSVYDSQGNLTEERNDQGVRVKNPDGTWGPWKQFTY